MKFFIAHDCRQRHDRICLVTDDYVPKHHATVNQDDGITEYDGIISMGGKETSSIETEDTSIKPLAINEKNIKKSILATKPDDDDYVLLLSSQFGENVTSVVWICLSESSLDYLNDQRAVNPEYVQKITDCTSNREDMICYYDINAAVKAFFSSVKEVGTTMEEVAQAKQERANRLRAAIQRINMK